jgi:hypothetical protein
VSALTCGWLAAIRQVAATAQLRARWDWHAAEAQWQAYLDDGHDSEMRAAFAELQREIAAFREAWWQAISERPTLVLLPPVAVSVVWAAVLNRRVPPADLPRTEAPTP